MFGEEVGQDVGHEVWVWRVSERDHIWAIVSRDVYIRARGVFDVVLLMADG